MSRDVVLIARNAGRAGLRVFINEEVGVKDILNLSGLGIELDPLRPHVMRGTQLD